MLHALGFSIALYAFYRCENFQFAKYSIVLEKNKYKFKLLFIDRDDDGNPLTPRRPDTGSPPLNEE